MKKTFLILTLFISTTQLNAQELMRISDESISLREFSNTLMKNNDKEITKEYLDEYIELFINYKLKVLEAKELGMDREDSFVSELEGYRRQLAKPYLQAKEFKEELINEAYERMKYDIHASHILFKLDQEKPNDTLSQYDKAILVKSKIEKGEITFVQAVSEYSDEQYNSGDLGYFTAFDMVYNFETTAYETKVGDVSNVIRTKYGYHLLKVHDKRLSFGEIKVSHIMLKIPQLATTEKINTIKPRIDEIYSKLNNGESFVDLADKYSEDRSTAVKGGKLPWFGLNEMAKQFEESSFSIENIGDYTSPFLTEFGWHIVMLDDRRRLGSFEEEYNDIKKLIDKGSRGTLSELALLKRIKKEYKFTNHKYNTYRKNSVKDAVNLDKLAEATLSSDDIRKSSKDNRELFFLDGNAFTQANLKDFLLEYQDVGMDFDLMYEKFVDFTCLEYEESKLEEKYPEYKTLLSEFRDGILLFDLTSEKVWTKAMEDSVGLKDFFDSHSDSYWWGERVEANIYSCANPKVVFRLKRMLWEKNKGWITIDEILEEINKSDPLNLQVKRGKFGVGENKYIDDVNWKEGISQLGPDKNKIVTIVEIIDLLSPARKLLNETKGKVISDYQNYLEENWIAELRKKYEIQIDKDILYSIIK